MKIKPSKQNFLRDVEKRVKPKENWEENFYTKILCHKKGCIEFEKGQEHFHWEDVICSIRQELARQEEKMIEDMRFSTLLAFNIAGYDEKKALKETEIILRSIKNS